MSAADSRRGTAAEIGEATASLRHRRLMIMALAGALLALVVLLLIVRLGSGDARPAIESRDDPVADLLAWIPADDELRSAFTVWTPDPGATTPIAPQAAVDLLGFDPVPRGLGSSPDWSQQNGWSASQVTGWAAAGPDGDLTVLDGQFEPEFIRERLLAAGFERIEYRGAEVFVRAEGPYAVGMVDGRLLVAVSDALIHQAIDVAIEGDGSLADEPTIAAMLRAMAPISALVAIDQIRHAAFCAPDLVAAEQPVSGNYVLVGYGRLGEGEERRTLIATSFSDEAAAETAFPIHESGWISGFANASGMGGRVDVFGDLTVVSRTGNLLIAEMVNGRDDGWVRAGIRYAIPVCEAAMAIAQSAIPAPVVETEPDPIIGQLAESLPETGRSGLFRAADLAGIASVRDVSPPEAGDDESDLVAWTSGLAPLPAFTIAPLSPEALIAWSNAFRAPISAVDGVAEVRADAESEVVGVMVGDWDLPAITSSLESQGYEWLDIGNVRHFAPRRSLDTLPPLMAGAGGAWENIAILGDRIWFSADQRAMRAAVDGATGEQPPADGPALRAAFTESTIGATAVELAGVGYLSRMGCAAILRGVAAVGAAWTVDDDSERAAVVYLPDGAVADFSLAEALERRLSNLSLPIVLAGQGTAAPAATVSLFEALSYRGTEAASSTDGAAIVSRFTVPEPERLSGLRFFAGTTGGCELTRVD